MSARLAVRAAVPTLLVLGAVAEAAVRPPMVASAARLPAQAVVAVVAVVRPMLAVRLPPRQAVPAAAALLAAAVGRALTVLAVQAAAVAPAQMPHRAVGRAVLAASLP
jgi:hypothetical protein